MYSILNGQPGEIVTNAFYAFRAYIIVLGQRFRELYQADIVDCDGETLSRDVQFYRIRYNTESL